jgi:ribosomal protein L28
VSKFTIKELLTLGGNHVANIGLTGSGRWVKLEMIRPSSEVDQERAKRKMNPNLELVKAFLRDNPEGVTVEQAAEAVKVNYWSVLALLGYLTRTGKATRVERAVIYKPFK